MLTPQFDIYEQVAAEVSGNVIDLGCGLGVGTQLFAKNADTVRGYDLNGDYLRFASRLFTHPKLSFHKADILNRGADKIQGQFDFVIMIDVIEHIEYDRDAIHQAGLLTAPGGVFICSTPNRLSRYRKSDNHVREYAPKEFENLLLAEFDDVTICSYGLERLKLQTQNPLIAICRQACGSTI